MDGKYLTQLEIERLGEMELSALHWTIFNRVLKQDWGDLFENDYLECLLNEILIRMAAE